MRIVAVADTHTFHDELVVPDGDVFVHAGDMCRGGDLDELAEVARWINDLPHRTKIVVAGNHDRAFEDHHAEARALFGADVVYLQDAGVVVDGVRFWGSPWQPAYNDWAFNLKTGEALAAKWALFPDDIDVLITHGPPAGHGDGFNKHGPWPRPLGCADLLEAVRRRRPRLHLFGHIHQDGGLTSDDGVVFVNCTTWECERPPTVIDLVGGRVVPVVVPPR
jgi:Icc-related predicted phosphoesterase